MKTFVRACGGTMIAMAALVALVSPVRAQEGQEKEKPKDSAPPSSPAPEAPALPSWVTDVKVGATFEGYYQFNFNEPPDRVNVLRAYDTRSNSFSIQQAAIVIDAAPDVEKNRRFGLRLDFQFGQATDTLQGSPANEPRPDVYRDIWQAYGSYIFPVGRGLRVDFGKFASNLGFETNYAKDNQAFSRAYLFNFLPFYHSGLRVTLPVNDKVSVMYALTNGIQQTEDFNNFKSQHVSVTLTPTLTVAADVNRTTNQLTRGADTIALRGVGTYAKYQLTKPIALGVRYEHLDDEGLFGGVAQTLQEATATLEYKLADGFLMRGAYRRDWSNREFFPGSRPDEHKRVQHTVLAGLVWWIGNKEGAW